jgi:hypothetical protein
LFATFQPRSCYEPTVTVFQLWRPFSRPMKKSRPNNMSHLVYGLDFAIKQEPLSPQIRRFDRLKEMNKFIRLTILSLAFVTLSLSSLSCNRVKFGGGLTAVTPEGAPPDNGSPVAPEATPTPNPSGTPNPNPTATPMPTPTPMPTMNPTPTPTIPGPTPTPTPTPVAPTPTPTVPTANYSKSVNVAKNMTQVDILLVIDDSSSMAADNARLAARMAGFVNSLAGANLDWQMCVTTSDVAYYTGVPLVWSGLGHHILKPTSGNLSSIIQQTIYDIGSGYSNDEQPIKAINYNVMKNSNYNCHRIGATLASIIISDEDERSVGGNYNLSSAQYQALDTYNMPDSLIKAVKDNLGTTKKFRVNAIVVPDKTCEAAQDAEGTPSFIGFLHMDLANKTGGSIGSICASDFTPNLNVFAGIIRNTVSSITLDCSPVQTPNYAGLPAGTTASLQPGAVVSFSPPLPEGTSVNINYVCNK